MLPPAAEVFLSCLTGLAPVGSLIEPFISEIQADLGYCQKVSIYKHLNTLIEAGCVRKSAVGFAGTIGVLTVIRRLEEMPERRLPPEVRLPGEPVDLGNRSEPARPSFIDTHARLAEIPPDTRNLTARICGDPLPGRSALDRRIHA